MSAAACSACYGSGYGVNEKPCPCGCRPALAPAPAIAPPVAVGSVDNPEFGALLEFYGRMYPQGNMARTAQAKAAIIGSIVAWGAQQRYAGIEVGRAEYQESFLYWNKRAEKAEARLKELEAQATTRLPLKTEPQGIVGSGPNAKEGSRPCWTPDCGTF